MGCTQTVRDFCCCCCAPRPEDGPFRAGINFRPFKLTTKTTLTEGSEFPVRSFTFALGKPFHQLGFEPPLCNLKIRAPGLLPFSKTYSVTSPPMQDTFDVAVKIHDNEAVATYLDTVNIGQEVWIAKTRSKVMVPGKNNGIIAFSFGVAEVLYPILEILTQDSSREVKLVVLNRHIKDLVRHADLEALDSEFPQLEITYFFSRENQSSCAEANPKFRPGRLDTWTVNELFENWDPDDTKFWIIGSRQMKQATTQYLNEAGFLDFRHDGGRGQLLQ